MFLGSDEVAIKSIDRHRIDQNKKYQDNLKSEIDALKNCKHQNIVQLKMIQV